MSQCLYKIAVFFIFITLLTCLKAFKYQPKPRQNNNCRYHEVGELVENPENCKLFFLCDENNEAVVASCPSNMLFNPISKICDNPANVKCELASTAPPAAISSPSIAGSVSKVNDYCYNTYLLQSYALVFVANPHNCQQYYMCYHGQALLQECSSHLHWNRKASKCDLPSNANCVARDDPNAMEILPALDEPIWGNGIKCPLYGEHIFPHMKRCDFFIYCINGHAILQHCPFFHDFDVVSGLCKLRNVAVCVKDLDLKFLKHIK